MKLPSFHRNYIAVWTTLFFMLLLGAMYFFVYIPQNEKRLEQQRFRSLQNIDKNIHEKIDNCLSLMKLLLKDTIDTKYINHLSASSSDKFTLTLNPEIGSPKFALPNAIDSLDSISIDHLKRRMTLSWIKKIKTQRDTISYSLTMSFSFEQFFGFLPKNVFDEYIVFNNGEALYTTIRSGVNYLKDSLFGKNSGQTSCAVKTCTVSGTQYKLFLQPVSFIAANDLVVAGLLSYNRYQQERFRLPSSIVLLLITLILAIVISFPWIKLYHMGSKDRLTTSDAIASIVVSMLLMSLLFFGFFKYNSHLRPGDAPDSKQTLAKQISAAFLNEVGTVYRKLQFIDTVVRSHALLYQNFTGNDSTEFQKKSLPKMRINSSDSISLYNLVKDPSITQVYWLSPGGKEKVNWTSENMNSPHGDFSEREYFKNIINRKEYLLKNDTANKFYLDQVVSWTRGKFTSVLSIPSKVKDSMVAALSFPMKSLRSAILPPGYQFAIIDKTGKVLYHSEEVRNLNENLVTEFSESNRLRSSLEARTADAFLTTYFSRNYSVRIEPLHTLPYSIVIFSDLDYRETRETAIYSFTFSMFFLLFIFFLLQLFFVFIVSSRKSFFKKQLYDTAWIGPKTTSHKQYNLAIIANAFIILLAVAFFYISTFLTYVFILLFSVTFISFFLNKIFAREYKRLSKLESLKFKNDTLVALGLLLCMIEIAAVKLLDASNTLILSAYQLVAILGGVFFYYRGYTILKRVPGGIRKFKWDYARSFSLMTLTRLIISSGIPVAFFYISAYNYEQNINIRYRQLQYANRLLDKLDNAHLIKIPGDTAYDKGYYKDGAWIKDIRLARLNANLANSAEDRITSKILDLFRFHFTDLAVREDKFSSSHAADTSFFFNPLLKDACKKDSATITYKKTGIPGSYLAISSAGLNYKIPSIFSNATFQGFYFWLLLLAALGIFYLIIYNILSRLFCLRLPDLSTRPSLGEKILADQELNRLSFVMGLPGSGKLARIKETLKDNKLKYKETLLHYNETDPASGNVFIADFINIPDLGDEKDRNQQWNSYAEPAFYKKNRLVIVNHFEYNIQDAVTNRIKLNFFERLMLFDQCKIMILSTIHPVAFLDSLTEPGSNNDKPVPGGDLERWHVLLGHYRIVIFSLQESLPCQLHSSFKSFFKETEFTHFLNKMQQPVLELIDSLPKNERPGKTDEIILKVQVASQYFYMYIWQSLTKEEKFLLYDLAEDNLVNSFDDYNLNMLLAKGVIMRRHGALTLFNRGFRNFILTAIGNTELLKIKDRMKDNGNWGRVRLPLLIILTALLIFLLASQKEAYSGLFTYVTALAAGLPALLKLFSVFERTPQKQ